jgi:hypothetical protein
MAQKVDEAFKLNNKVVKMKLTPTMVKTKLAKKKIMKQRFKAYKVVNMAQKVD